MSFTELDQKVVNSIRCFAIEMVAKANSGHQGLPMGFAPAMHVLCSRHLKVNKDEPKWINRDRLILSSGHGSALLYTMLHLLGFKLTLNDIQNFRQLKSKTPGHPESRVTDGVEFTTGPLGQGLASSVGIAMGEKYLQSKINGEGKNVIDHKVYVICGDGCLQEGVTNEASSFAGHLGLDNLILLYDDNSITIDGKTDLTWTEDVYKRYEALGWDVQKVANGNTDLEAIHKAIEKAKQVKGKPCLIGIKTTIGIGSKKAGQNSAHGFHSKLADILEIRKAFGLKEEHFHLDEDVKKMYQDVQEKGKKAFEEWKEMMKTFDPEKEKILSSFMKKEMPGAEEMIEQMKDIKSTSPVATRKASGVILNKMAEIYPFLIGGSADLAGSNCTAIKGEKVFQKPKYDGRMLAYGIREHAMSSICNGLCEYQYGSGYVPFCATFLVFESYMLAGMRMAALAQLQVLYVLTHDSVCVGEDGPTHQPIEMFSQIRSIPNMNLLRPADMEEVKAAYALAMSMKQTPSVLALSRQNLKPLTGFSDAKKALKGGYVIKDAEKCELILVASGSEVSSCVEVSEMEEFKGKIRVVSMLGMDVFDKQSLEYKKEVFKNCEVPVMSVEIGTTQGWEKYSHVQVGMKTFGESAPGDLLYDHFGFSPKKLAEKVKKVLKFYQKSKPYSFLDKPLI